MTRWWIGLLVLLNMALLAWNMGALAPWGTAPGTAQEGPSATLSIEARAPAAPASAAASVALPTSPASVPKAPASAARAKPAASAPDAD